MPGLLLPASVLCLMQAAAKPPTAPAPQKPVLSAVSALAWSHDGARLAVGLYQRVAVYDTTSWQLSASLDKVEDTVRVLVWSLDSRQLAVGSGLPGRSGRLDLWEPGSSSPPLTVAQHTDTVECAAFGAPGQLLVGSADNRGRYIPQIGGGGGKVLDQHNGRVLSAAFSTRENFVFLTGGADRIVKVWDMKTQTPVVSFDQSEGPVVGLCALPGGNQFAGASQDGRILFWQVYYNEKRMQWGGSLTRQVRAHEYGVWNLSISKNGQRMITCGADDHVKVWEVGSMRQVADFAEPLQPTYAVALSPDGRTAAMGGKDGLVRICDAEKKNLLQEITPPQPPPLPMPKPQLMTPAKPLKPSPQKPLPRRKP